MAISLNNAASVGSNGVNLSTLSTTLTVSSGVTLLVAVVSLASSGSDTVSSVTWNGVGFTKYYAYDNTVGGVSVWYLISPTPAVGATVQVNLSAAQYYWGATVLSLTGTATTSPIYGSTGAAAPNSTSQSISQTLNTAGDCVIAGLYVKGGYGVSVAATLTTGNINYQSINISSGVFGISGDCAYNSTGNTLTWSLANASSGGGVVSICCIAQAVVISGSGSNAAVPTSSGSGNVIVLGSGSSVAVPTSSGAGNEIIGGTGQTTALSTSSGAGEVDTIVSTSTAMPTSLGFGAVIVLGSGSSSAVAQSRGTGTEIIAGSGQTTVEPSSSGSGGSVFIVQWWPGARH